MHPHTPAVRRFADSQIRRFADSTTPPLARIITFPPMEHFTASVHVSEPTIIVRLMNALACVENLLCSLVCSSFSRILSQNSAQSQLLLWDCFADSLFLTELQNGSRSLIQFYFIISQARSTAAMHRSEGVRHRHGRHVALRCVYADLELAAEPSPVLLQ
jgi:hypothetical protein